MMKNSSTPSTMKKIAVATQKTGTNRSKPFCAYGPLGSSADCVAFGAQAAATTARATRPRTRIVLLRTFPVDLRERPAGTEARRTVAPFNGGAGPKVAGSDRRVEVGDRAKDRAEQAGPDVRGDEGADR